MNLSLATLLLLVAVVCFGIAAVGRRQAGRIDLVSLGLALGFASFLVGALR